MTAALRSADPETEILAVSPKTGPDSIECYVDEYLSVPGVLQEIIKGDREEKADAFIIACFGDPGLSAAREITDKPVLGICESAITAAKFIAPYFSIVSVLEPVKKSYGRYCQSLWSRKLLPIHKINRSFCAGFWKTP